MHGFRVLVYGIQTILILLVFYMNTFIEVANFKALASGNYGSFILLVILEAIYHSAAYVFSYTSTRK